MPSDKQKRLANLLQTFVLGWVDALLEGPALTTARHLDNVELSDTCFTLKQAQGPSELHLLLLEKLCSISPY